MSMSNVGATACQYEACFVGDRWDGFFVGEDFVRVVFWAIENSEEIAIS